MAEKDLKLILDKNGEFELLSNPYDINTIPNTGEYLMDALRKQIYKVEKIIHFDLHTILIVKETELEGQQIYSLIYNLD